MPYAITDLGERGGEVVAVLVQEVVLISPELLPQLIHNLPHVSWGEVRPAHLDRLPAMNNTLI